MPARGYSQLTIKQLFVTSGHYCAYPGCEQSIVDFSGDSPVILGEIAHIEGSSDDGPRANRLLSNTQRDSYPNLIVLCPTHHSLIDKSPELFPVETLKEWKNEQERSTTEKLSAGAVSVTFAELQIVCDAYADGDMELTSTPMVAVPPEDKMRANGLTDALRPTMSIGLSLAPQVAEFIRRQAQLSSRFPERLRGGFLNEYNSLVSDGALGDDLFLALIEFGANAAATPQDDSARHFTIRAASTAILCHLFQVCDIFEAPNDPTE